MKKPFYKSYAMTKGAAITRRSALILLMLILLGVAASSCKKKEKLPTAVSEEYQKAAHNLCNAIVDCIKADLAKRMKEHPARRDLLLKQMDRDLCLKRQYHMIGELSVDPLPEASEASHQIENYQHYQACSQAVVAAGSCIERMETHRTFPSCQKLRTLFE